MATSLLTNAKSTTGYVVEPGSGSNPNIITFSYNGKNNLVGKFALLAETINMQFSQGMSRKYFLNTGYSAYIKGFGQGQLTIQGLVGDAQAFASLFGTDKQDPCANVFTANLTAGTITACTNLQTQLAEGAPQQTKGGVFTLTGVTPQTIQINAQTMQDGVVFYQATGVFLFDGLELDEGTPA